MKKASLACVLILLPSLAGAQSQLDRLEATSEATSVHMFTLMTNEMAANGVDPAPLQAVIPDMTWDDAMRAAGDCMLGEYTGILGSAGVDELLDNMDALSVELAAMAEAGATVSEMGDPGDMMPEGLTQAESMRITQECGMVELQLQRMSESGFTAAMMMGAAQ